MIAGFDEAGRGSLVGPLITSLIIFPKDYKSLDFYSEINDSKKLTKKKRYILYKKIKEKCIVFYKKITPQEIDKHSLTKLEMDALEKMVKKAKEKVKLERVYVDMFSHKTKAMSKKYDDIEFIIEHKADYKYKVVGAASIIAKVIRDKEIERINKICNIGSGYPSDKKTIEGVRRCWRKIFPYLRKKWSTYEKLKSKVLQSNLSEF